MSIKAMNYIWEHSEQKGTKLLVLLAIADRCNDEGECFPGTLRIASKTRIKQAALRKHMRELRC